MADDDLQRLVQRRLLELSSSVQAASFIVITPAGTGSWTVPAMRNCPEIVPSTSVSTLR